MTPVPSSPRSISVLLALVLALWLVPGLASAHLHGGYSHDGNGGGYTNPDWMSRLPNDLRISQLSIPGTHDSGAYRFGGDITETQSMDFGTQLHAGIRAWDVRLGSLDLICPTSQLQIFHGATYQFLDFTDALNAVSSFLASHPGEAVLMRIVHEHGCSDGFEQRVRDAFARYPGLLYTGAESNPLLGDIRGQVVVLQDFDGGDLGIPWSSLDIQDKYNLGSNWDLYGKWEHVKGHFAKAGDGDPMTTYVNFLSGSGGSFPYFVASGHSSPGSSAPRLSTGRTTGVWGGSWPDFPRVACAFNPFIWDTDCTIAFEGTNVLATEWIQQGRFAFGGIVMADYPGGGLIDSIIRLNDPVHVYEAESSLALGHRIGRPDGDGWSANVADDSPGHLIFGPYATDWGEGPKTAIFRALTDSVLGNGEVAWIDVFDATTQQVLAARPVSASEFEQPWRYQDIALDFGLDGRGGHAIEARMWWNDIAFVKVDLVRMVDRPFVRERFEAESNPSLYHLTGRAEGNAWSASVARDAQNTLVFGPYTKRFGVGQKTAVFRMKVAENTSGAPVGFVDVFDATAGDQLASVLLRSTDFAQPEVFQDIELHFSLDGRAGHQIETRVWWYDQVDTAIDWIEVIAR